MRFHACVFPLLSLALPLLFAQSARADADDTFNIVPSISVMHDDNLFRLSSGVDPQTVLGKSTKADDITVSSLAFKINKPYSLQRFELEASLVDYRYKNFSYLSYRSQPYKAAWRWSLTPRLHGNLTTDHTTSLNNFTDYTGYTRRNTHTNENTRFDGVADIGASWHLLGGLSRATITNSELTVGEGDSRVNRAEFGIRHTTPSGSALSVVTRSGRGNYINRSDPLPATLIDNRFDDSENEVRVLWPITGKTSIDGRLAHFKRKHAHFAERDFDGAVGNINVNWQISAKSFLTVGVARELSSYQTNNTNYTSTDRLTVVPLWQISAKTALRGRYDYARRDYVGGSALGSSSNRSDTVRTAMIALEWQPYRTLSLNSSIQNEKRSSNQPGLDYASTVYSVAAQMTF